eukprot:scaffold14527_cov21-Tisochrysis_lutea.AAC.1
MSFSMRHRASVSKHSSFTTRSQKGPFDFTHAFTREVPDSFSNALTMEPESGQSINIPRRDQVPCIPAISLQKRSQQPAYICLQHEVKLHGFDCVGPRHVMCDGNVYLRRAHSWTTQGKDRAQELHNDAADSAAPYERAARCATRKACLCKVCCPTLCPPARGPHQKAELKAPAMA